MLERLKKIQWEAVVVENGALSIGRCMAWILFALMGYMWLSGEAMPPLLMESWMTTMVYNGGKKITGPVQEYFLAKRQKTERKTTFVAKPFEDDREELPETG